LLVGFGIRTPEDARSIVRYADGVIVGSRIVQLIQNTKSKAHLISYVKSLKQAIA
jgi:tryptophan synthase alpha chain